MVKRTGPLDFSEKWSKYCQLIGVIVRDKQQEFCFAGIVGFSQVKAATEGPNEAC